MKLEKVAGATSEIWQVFVRDSSSTTGGGLTGLVYNTASLTAYYHRDTDTTATAITLVTMTVGTFTSSGFKEIDSTNMPGWYQFCPPNAAIASGAKSCAFHLKGATNMAPLPIEVQLTAINPDSATAFMTSVGSVTGAVGSVTAAVTISAGTGAGQLDFTSGVVKANATQWLGGTIPAVNVTGVPLVDLKYTLGTISPATAGSVRADAVTGLTASDVGAIKTKTDFLPSATAGSAGGVFIAGSNAATSITTALTSNIVGNITGNLSGSVGSVTGAVGSVTGAVGSVTGNVGGNVTGSVGSVAAGGITASSIATDAIDADALAADAVTEIQSGLSTAAVTNAIKAKTDSLTFTVAANLDANIQYVNDVAIQGTGAVGSDEWRKV